MTGAPGKFVYFIKPVGLDGPIKIGCSNAPEERLESILIWSPFRLEIIGVVPGVFTDENFLHQCFADLHHHGEWFFAAPRLLKAIAAILEAGSIDVVRTTLVPVGQIRGGPRRKIVGAEGYRSMASRIRIACTKLRIDTPDLLEYFSEPNEVRGIMDRWFGRDNYRKARNPVRPSAEEMALLEAFVADPKGNGAIRHEAPRLRRSGAAA